MTSDRQRRANGVNAKASSGPKTKAGKARSARNALRHGLNIPVSSEPGLAQQIEVIARKITGSDLNAKALECARQIGEAQIDLNRVRSLRREAMERMMSDPRGGSPSPTVKEVRLLGRFLERVERDRVTLLDLEMINQVLPKPLEGDAKLAAILGDSRGELARLDRYERRALSRRKTAIRVYDGVRSLNN